MGSVHSLLGMMDDTCNGRLDRVVATGEASCATIAAESRVPGD